MTEDLTAKGAEAISDLLTMLGVDPDERQDHGGPTTAETLAAAVLRAGGVSAGYAGEPGAQVAREQTTVHADTSVLEVVARVNVALIADAASALQTLRERTGYKQVDIVNRALQLYEFIDAQQRCGSALLFRDNEGSYERVRFL